MNAFRRPGRVRLAASGLAALVLTSGVSVSDMATAEASQDATRRPEVSFKFAASHIDAGTGPTISYTAAGVPRGGKVLVQRSYGRKLKTVKSVPAGTGTITLPAVGQGKYTYRLAITDSSGETVASSEHKLYAYADVTLATFLEDSTSTVQIGDHVFRYVISSRNDRDEIIKVNGSSCDQFTMDVGADTSYYDDTNPTTISVIQERADVQSFNVSPNSTSQATIGLAKGAWQVNAAGDGEYYIYLNGTLSCYTPSGSPRFY